MRCINETTMMFFLDGELSKRKALAIRAHLQECSACRDRVRHLSGENEKIARLFSIEHRMADQTRRIMGRITSGTPPDIRKRSILSPSNWRITGLVAAVLIIFFVLSFFVFFHRGSTISESAGKVLVQTASIDGHPVQTHVFDAGDDDMVFIWLEKI